MDDKTNFSRLMPTRLSGTGIVERLEIIDVWCNLKQCGGLTWLTCPWLPYFTTDLHHWLCDQDDATKIRRETAIQTSVECNRYAWSTDRIDDDDDMRRTVSERDWERETSSVCQSPRRQAAQHAPRRCVSPPVHHRAAASSWRSLLPDDVCHWWGSAWRCWSRSRVTSCRPTQPRRSYEPSPPSLHTLK